MSVICVDVINGAEQAALSELRLDLIACVDSIGTAYDFSSGIRLYNSITPVECGQRADGFECTRCAEQAATTQGHTVLYGDHESFGQCLAMKFQFPHPLRWGMLYQARVNGSHAGTGMTDRMIHGLDESVFQLVQTLCLDLQTLAWMPETFDEPLQALLMLGKLLFDAGCEPVV